MNDIPENKQKRLMSLNQDVLAVSPGSTSSREAINTTRPMRQTRTEEPSQQLPASRGRGVAVALGGLAIIMLILLGVVSMTMLQMQQRVDELQQQLSASGQSVDLAPMEARINALESQLGPVDKRLTVLEQQPLVVQGDSRSPEAASQAGLAQANARLRKLDIEMNRLSSEVSNVSGQVSGVLARVQKAETLAASQRNALAVLTPRIDAIEAESGQSDRAAKLAEIEERLERTNNDIRSLYRMLEMGR